MRTELAMVECLHFLGRTCTYPTISLSNEQVQGDAAEQTERVIPGCRQPGRLKGVTLLSLGSKQVTKLEKGSAERSDRGSLRFKHHCGWESKADIRKRLGDAP